MDSDGELLRIRGIGAARARWLHETFGVRGLADLAALEPGEISARPADGGRGPVAPDTLAQWVTTAREMVSAQTSDEAEWTVRASVVVEFQSRVGDGGTTDWRTSAHLVEEDGDEAWQGIDCGGLGRWMRGHLAGTDAGHAVVDIAGPSSAEPEASPVDEGVGLKARVVDGDGYRGARLVRIGLPWSVDLCWDTGGIPELVGPGEWRVELSMWPIGESAPLALPQMVVPADAADGDGRHEHRIDIPPGLVGSAHCGAPYRATATLTFHRGGDPSPAVAGAVDLGFIRFYDPARPRRQESAQRRRAVEL